MCASCLLGLPHQINSLPFPIRGSWPIKGYINRTPILWLPIGSWGVLIGDLRERREGNWSVYSLDLLPVGTQPKVTALFKVPLLTVPYNHSCPHLHAQGANCLCSYQLCSYSVLSLLNSSFTDPCMNVTEPHTNYPILSDLFPDRLLTHNCWPKMFIFRSLKK